MSGRVVDQNGNAVAGTNVQIRRGQESPIQEVQSDEDGRFEFDRVPPGLFLLTTTGEGFVTQTLSHALRPGESYVVPPITMSLATVVTEVRVSPSIEEIAQEEFKDLEKQRVLGIVPNFYGIREPVPSVPYSCTLSPVPSFVKGAINAGSRTIPPSSATSLPAAFRIIYP